MNSAIPVDSDEYGNLPEPQQLPDALPSVVKFDEKLLPESFIPWVTDIAERMQCPIDFLAASSLVALSGAVSRRATIQPKKHDDWTVVPNLWGGVIARPGQLKSPAVDESMKPLKRLEVKASENYRRALQDYEGQKRIGKVMQSEIDKQIKEAVKKGKSTDGILNQYDAGEPPTCERYIVPDATPEALTEILKVNPNGVLVYRDELMGFLASMDKEGREDARALYLEAWNGFGSFVSDRIGRGHVFVPSVCVSILGSIQPGKLENYVRQAVKGGSGDDGFLQRFQVLVYPDSSKEWKNVDRYPNNEAKNHVFEVFKQLIELSEDKPRRFDDEAQEFFNDWRLILEQKVRRDLFHPAFEAHIAKYRSLMPSIALLLYLADSGPGDVPLEYAELSAAWCEYLESHARRVYSVINNGPAATARLVANKILKHKLSNPFTAKDVYRPQWSGLTDRSLVTEALELLCEDDWLFSQTEHTGGRPKTLYTINPRVFL